MKTLILKTQKLTATDWAVYAMATVAGIAIVLFVINAVVSGISSTVYL